MQRCFPRAVCSSSSEPFFYPSDHPWDPSSTLPLLFPLGSTQSRAIAKVQEFHHKLMTYSSLYLPPIPDLTSAGHIVGPLKCLLKNEPFRNERLPYHVIQPSIDHFYRICQFPGLVCRFPALGAVWEEPWVETVGPGCQSKVTSHTAVCTARFPIS